MSDDFQRDALAPLMCPRHDCESTRHALNQLRVENKHLRAEIERLRQQRGCRKDIGRGVMGEREQVTSETLCTHGRKAHERCRECEDSYHAGTGTGFDRPGGPQQLCKRLDAQPSADQCLSWVDMFAQVCALHSNRTVAEALGYSEAYVSDLRRGMRLPTVEVTDRLCDWMGRGPAGRLEWHQAGARAHGWRV